MKNERTNKKRYKIITYFCVFLLVVVTGIGLALGKTQNKVKAGVIIEEKLQSDSSLTMATTDNNLYARLPSNISAGATNAGNIFYGPQDNTSYRLGYIGITSINFEFMGITLNFARTNLGTTLALTGGTFTVNYINNIDDATSDYCYVSIDDIISGIKNIGSNGELIENYGSESIYMKQAQGFYRKYNTIISVNNIFDLPNNALTLLYINDVSGLDTSAMQDEITMNWGYIDSNDNTLYAEYAPTISAQNMQTSDKIIRLGIPLNAVGDAMDYYDISQQALLNISSLPQGSATATAHIYGVYVWHNSNNIKWGLAEFNTQVDPVPGSALNMNYITSLTEIYDYQNMNTNSMTCRLSVSSNFNFITINNQTNGPDKDSINAVIQQGGFLPAWSVYNWARGTYSGFIAGDASARADYLEGQPGYEAIYQAGFSDGFANAELGTANWFITSFKAVDSFLNIHIFPNITFGVLLGIPFVISIVWFIIRMFRGGGGGD